MSQAEEISNKEFSLAIFYWLIEDWQGCKQELKRVNSISTTGNQGLATVLESLIHLEQKNEMPGSLKAFQNRTSQDKKLLQHYLFANCEKDLLKAKYLLGEEVTDSRVRKLLKAFADMMPTAKSTKLVKDTIVSKRANSNTHARIDSIDAWFKHLQQKELCPTSADLEQAETTLNLLESSNSVLKQKMILADQFTVQRNFEKACRIYSELADYTEPTEPLVVKLARAQRNLGLLDSAIETIESGINKLGRRSLLIHNLAIYRRDNQEFGTCLQLVKEIIRDHGDYSLKIGFATFCSDILRKNAEYKNAYEHLKYAARLHRNTGKEINLTVEAMLAELEANVAQGKREFFEVSSVFYDTIYKNSDKYALEASDSVYEPTWKEVCSILEKGNIEKVIDIGCGPGQFAEYLSERLPQIEYLGLDFSETAINLARKRCPHLNFACEDIRNYTSSKNNKKTAYVLLEVLEHIKDDVSLLKLLPQDSNIIFSVPNFDSFGHVRFFKNSKVLAERFVDTLKVNYLEEVKLSGIASIFIVASLVEKLENT